MQTRTKWILGGVALVAAYQLRANWGKFGTPGPMGTRPAVPLRPGIRPPGSGSFVPSKEPCDWCGEPLTPPMARPVANVPSPSNVGNLLSFHVVNVSGVRCADKWAAVELGPNITIPEWKAEVEAGENDPFLVGGG